MRKLTKMYIDMNNCMNFCWGKDKHCVFDLEALIDETKEFINDDDGRCVEEIEEFIRDGVYEATSNDEIYTQLPEEIWNITTTLILYECYKEKLLILGYSKD